MADRDLPDDYANLDELAVPRLEEIQEPETGRTEGRLEERQNSSPTALVPAPSRRATQLYTISYLVLFALLGTLARLGLTALTTYPGTPIIFPVIWPNFGGSLVMGFLAEDRMLFRFEWGVPTFEQKIQNAKRKEERGGGGGDDGQDVPTDVDLTKAKKAHLSVKKTIPLYIGLTTGFCGSFTSFSSFVRDALLAITDDLHAPGAVETANQGSRNGGYSFMAMLGVILTTVILSLAGYIFGAHVARGVEKQLPSLPYRLTRRVVDPALAFLAWGCWLGAVFLALFPPHDSWRGRVVFSLVFAPLGCLGRFYLALLLNSKQPSFPLGTFAANMLGTAVLGMCYDIQHASIGGVVGCQVLQGIDDGFCGCLTTVSTWVAELASLRRRHSYTYGGVSVVVATLLMIAIMGGLRWSEGFASMACSV